MSTPLTIKAKAAILHKIVFEVRYRYGYTYLDKCGKTINLIMRDAPEWIVRADQPNPQLAPMVSSETVASFTSLPLNTASASNSRWEQIRYRMTI